MGTNGPIWGQPGTNSNTRLTTCNRRIYPLWGQGDRGTHIKDILESIEYSVCGSVVFISRLSHLSPRPRNSKTVRSVLCQQD